MGGGKLQPAPLMFRVAPHIVEDLGLNLYTDLPRVLVEFVANAYDADSPDVFIEMDFDDIKRCREQVLSSFRKPKNSPQRSAKICFHCLTGLFQSKLQSRFLTTGMECLAMTLRKSFLSQAEGGGKKKTPFARPEIELSWDVKAWANSLDLEWLIS